MSSIELINTGILMGVIHVLTGPDHLSALATLCGTNLSSSSSSSNTNNGSGSRSSSYGRQCESFLLGIKWGLGHSVGLLLVGGVLIAWQEIDDDEWIAMDDTLMLILNGFVGIFMLGLGCYGLLKAVHHRNDESAATLLLDGSGDNKESVELNNSSSNSRRHSNYSNPIREEEGEDENSDDDEEDASFFKDPEISGGPTIMDRRRQSFEILHQMSEVLNRDGDSMRQDSSLHDTTTASSDMEDVEKRVLHAAHSLRRNASSISNDSDKNDPVNEEQFMKTVKASAKLALSKSFMDILMNDRDSSTPLSANVLMSKHENAQKVVLDKIYDDEQQQSRSSRIMRSMLSCCCHYNNCCNNCTPGLLALIIGCIHGVAGPGGVLGVIPAVQLKDAKLSAIYLSTFCATSTFTMGGFALLYGSFSTWLAGGEQSSHRQQQEGRRSYARSRVFLVEAGSAMLSIAVGIIWLVLLSMGELEEVFS